MMDMTVDLASDRVWQLGQADGVEHCVCFSPAGSVRFEKAGKERSIDLTREIELGLMRQGDILVHNHPSLSSLSDMDIVLATQQGITVYAVTRDRSLYWSAGFSSEKQVNEVNKVLTRFDNEFYQTGLADDPDFSQFYNHIFLSSIAEKKLIDYHYQLGDMTRQGLKRFDSIYSQLVRRAI